MDLKHRKATPNAWINSAEETLNNGLRTGGNWGYPLIYIKGTILERFQVDAQESN